MVSIWIKVLNLSLSASIVAFIVMLIRLLLAKAPKRFSYALDAFRALLIIQGKCPWAMNNAVGSCTVLNYGIIDLCYNRAK